MPSDNPTQPPTNPAGPDETDDLRGKLLQASAESLILRQQLEFTQLLQQHERECTRQFRTHKREVHSEINRRLVAMSLGGLVVAIIAWYQTVTPIRKTVSDRLEKEFASENIRNLISQAAQNAAQAQTKQLMDATIKPATDEALEDIRKHRDEVSLLANQLKQRTEAITSQVHSEMSQQALEQDAALENMRAEYIKDLGQLRALLDYQEKLKDIQLLKGEIIAGDVTSLDKLASYSSADKSLTDAAVASIIEAKELYISGNRVSGIKIWLTKPDGSQGLTDEQIPTEGLIGVFLLNESKNWEWRTRAAQLLSVRREANVPEALLAAMNSDQNLWVRRAALLSFQSLTGFQADDVFGFKQATDWWAKNKDTYSKSIPKK